MMKTIRKYWKKKIRIFKRRLVKMVKQSWEYFVSAYVLRMY